MSDTSLVFNLVARDRASGEVSAMGERFNTAAAGIGAGFATALGASVLSEMDVEAAGDKLAGQLGLGQAEAASVAKVSASVYKDAWGDSTGTVNEAIRNVYKNISDTSAAENGLEGVTTKVLAIAEAFDEDLTMATAAAGQLVRTGLAKDVDEALDIITVGLQGAADKSGDYLESINEYSTQWRRLGLDGKQATGLLTQALAAGARDADQVSDAIGIFGETALKGGKKVDDAYKSIGLSSKTIGRLMREGGTSAQKAFQMTMDALRGTKDETLRLNAAAELFGDPANVMGDALYAMDPASAAAAGGMDKATGATDRLAEGLSGNASKALERFKRGAMTQLGEVGGVLAQFAMDNQAVVVPLAYAFTGLALTVLAVKGAMMAYSAIAAIVTGAHTIISASCWTVIGNWFRMTAIGIGAYLKIAAGAVASAATTAAAWVGSALTAMGTWIAAVVRTAVTAAAQFVMMAARAVAWAVTMAAQWLIAMGPIGWVIAAVIGLAVLIIANWDKIKRYTGIVWDWLWTKIKAIGSYILNYVLGWKLVSYFLSHWDRIKSGVATKGAQLLGWFRSFPGRLTSALGSLGSLLYSKGVNVVQGLWQGISSMGGWIRSQIMGWARSVIPGPIADALGIASPSKVTTAQGRWIARGLVVGLTGSAKQVRAAALKLADIVRDSMKPGKRRNAALKVIDTGTKQLVALANREVVVAAKLKTANARLQDLVKARATLVADVRKGVLDAANITQGADAGGVTATSIWANLNAQLNKAKQFAAQLATLRKKGIRADLIAQIAQAGVEQGGAAAAALASASSGQIAQINSTQAQLVAAADKAGNVAGDAMYGAGIQAAQGLVKGLQKEQKAIEKQMLTIATSMQKAIKRALGIRSPSRVMAMLGQWIPAGLVQGIDDGRPAVARSMATLTQAPPASAGLLTGQQMAPAAPLLRQGAAGGGVVIVRLDATGGDSATRTFLQKLVRVEGRGSVQVAFGQP
ncbi:phage tail tape measure protein [Streptomyces zaomyceticus]|uniref:phage tail tape measure protein n=1 Tax=Streptomyces zaomyceticus TaxID=68286 RepID=UPI0037139B55